MLQSIASNAGLGDGITAHVGRHTFATALVRGGTGLVVVADLLGHACLAPSAPAPAPPKTTAPRPSTCSPQTADQREQREQHSVS
jgi:hypothetical protein